MLRQFLQTSLLFLFFLLTAPLTTAQAESLNGGWLADNGDMLFIAKSTKGTVVALDVAEDKTLRYVFTGTLIGDHLALATRDSSATLDATVTGDTMTGSITPSDAAAENFSASLFFAYSGGSYDGVWKHDSVEDYLFYATLKLKGTVTTIVPYFSINEETDAITYNIFLGTPAATDSKGNISYAGLSMLDYSVLKLVFSSTSTASATLIQGDVVTKFTVSKIYAVTKKSGEF